MANEIAVLRDVSARLSSAGIKFMVTGSVAMNFYAVPRMTRDIDLVVALEEPDTDKVLRLFESDYYIDERAVRRAIVGHSMFNLVHNAGVVKVDIIVLKRDAFRQEEFARRREITIGDFETWIVSREDLILSKLYWARDSRSEMQLRDVSNLLTADYDEDYVRSRAQMLGIGQLLEKVLGQS
ncbi:MAG TPA: nucleotidyltransferase [Blastocatellia bacterium]|nr:nucleotidyltransferase [Blastocatellia bacterium]